MRPALALLLALAACQKASPPEPEAKLAPPADLLAVVSLAHPGAFVTRLARYADQVAPSAGAALDGKTLAGALASLIDAATPGGLDLDRPVSVLFFDPKTHPHPFVLLASFASPDQLGGGLKVERGDGVALVGAEAEVAAARAWALGALAKRAAPEAATAEIWLGTVLARYGAAVQAFPASLAGAPMGASMQGVLQAEVDALIALGGQVDRVLIAFDATGDSASLEVTLASRSGTTLERFAAAQRPFDPALATLLPITDATTMVMAGHIEIAAFADRIYDLIGPAFLAWSGRKDEAAVRQLFLDWFKRFDGNLSAVARMGMAGPMELVEILGVDDGPAAQRTIGALLGGKPFSASMMGMKMSLTPALGAAQHGGASIDTYTSTLDPATLAPLQLEMQKRMYPPDGAARMAVAGWGRSLGMAVGSSAVATLGAVMDTVAAGTRAQLTPHLKRVLDAASQRKESAVLIMNLAAMLGGHGAQSGLAMTVGFGAGQARLRLELPAAHIGELKAAMQGSGMVPR